MRSTSAILRGIAQGLLLRELEETRAAIAKNQERIDRLNQQESTSKEQPSEQQQPHQSRRTRNLRPAKSR